MKLPAKSYADAVNLFGTIAGRSDSPLYRKARRGFRGYPIATVALYWSEGDSLNRALRFRS